MRLVRPHHHAPRRRIEAKHIERMPRGDAEPTPLADGEVDDAGMGAEHAAGFVYDLARLGGARLEALDHLAVAAGRHEADVLAVVLFRNGKTETARQLARLRLGQVAEREAQQLELLPRGGKQEIALVALGVARAIERAVALGQPSGGDVMAGGQHARAELARGRQQVAEFDGLIALDAGYRGLSRHVAVGKAVDDRLLEALLVVEDVMGNADALRHRTGVIDVLPGATGAG